MNKTLLTKLTCIKEYINHLKGDINLYNFPINPKEIKKISFNRMWYSLSCLSSASKYWFEELTNINIETDVASEFRYRNIKFNKKNLYIFVSQSGETADTFAALDLCKKNNVKTCAIVNVVESSIARLSDFVLPIHAGPEIGVASTKAFVLDKLLVLYILALKISESRKEISIKIILKKLINLKKLPDLIKRNFKM